MEVFLVEEPAGLFLIDKSGAIKGRVLFPADARMAAQSLRRVQRGEPSDDLLAELKRLIADGLKTFVTESPTLAGVIEGKLHIATRVERQARPVMDFRGKLSGEWKGRGKWIQEQQLGLDMFRSPEDYRKFVRDVTIQLARGAITAAASRRDLFAVQAVRAVDDLDKTLNLFAGRIREWYGLHFPELDALVEKHDTYIRLVSALAVRKNFVAQNLIAQGLPEDRAEQIADAAKRSMGADIDEEDLEWLKNFCNDVGELFKFRNKAESYVDGIMKTTAPNLSALIGSVLAARLLSIAGGLENLAKMPSSTLQVLGAEKALFRSLKTGARPPKHGVIFQYAAIHQGPRWQRGKIARTLSGKLSIAARIDAYGGEFIGEKLREDLEKKLKEISVKYAEPPARPSKPSKGRRKAK
jgi:nucleolar protein 56